MKESHQIEIKRLLDHVRLALNRCRAPEGAALRALAAEVKQWKARRSALRAEQAKGGAR